ncbi:MAG: hypothetical protein WBO14_08220 [Gammaproteobacteria bacterium]
MNKLALHLDPFLRSRVTAYAYTGYGYTGCPDLRCYLIFVRALPSWPSCNVSYSILSNSAAGEPPARLSASLVRFTLGGLRANSFTQHAG